MYQELLGVRDGGVSMQSCIDLYVSLKHTQAPSSPDNYCNIVIHPSHSQISRGLSILNVDASSSVCVADQMTKDVFVTLPYKSTHVRVG